MQGSEVQELGQLLREARERKGVTLADAQQATKIRLSFLQALESEDFSVLPPPFYIRGFIKTYAVYLNLDPRTTVQLFDEVLENVHTSRMVEQQTPPSADSGGRAMISLDGLSQAEADQVVNSNERLNLRALPPPTHLVSGQRRSTGYSQAFDDSPADGFGAGYSPRKPGTLGSSDKYVLKQVMLPSARGSFYMPNFIPTILVIVIVLAAALLIYRGISNQPKDTASYEEAASATITAGGYAGPYAITPDPTMSSLRATITAGDVTSSVLKPPAYYTPDASIQALDRTPTTGGAGIAANTGTRTTVSGTNTTVAPANSTTPANKPAAPAPTTAPPAPTAPPEPTATPAPTATPTPPPSPTPVPDPINVVVSIADTDPKGSWIRITVDDKVQVEKVAAPNETFNFTGMKVAVRAGNPGLIRVTVNGEPKEFVKPQGGIITHTWFAGGKDTVE